MRSDPCQQIYTMHRIVNMSDLVYLQATIPIRFCKTFYLFAVQANFLAKVFESAKEVRGALRIVEMVRGALREDPPSEFKAFQVGKGLLDQVLLMILNLRHPIEVLKVTTEADTPQLSLKTPEEAVSYLDAVIRSGTSTQEKSGTVFLMGNTGVHTSKKQTNWRILFENIATGETSPAIAPFHFFLAISSCLDFITK